MDAAINWEYLKFVESSVLYSRICTNTGSDVAGFILYNLESAKLNVADYLLKDDCNSKHNNLKDCRLLIDLRDASEIDDLTKYFREINGKMATDGVYVGCFESKYNIQLKLFKKYNRVLSCFIRTVNYTFRNFVPRWKRFTKQGKSVISSMYRNNSLAEVLGRLAYCGFEVINYKYYENLTYFIIRKKAEPKTEPVSTSRFVVKLNRVGQGGRMIKIYKFRTMYPFSEFIQDYVVRLNGYDKIGKPKNDFRLTTCGKLIRKLWIDEIPQLINLLKGDIKIVGVRPISRYGFSALPQDLQLKRTRYKPGLIPPNVSLRISGFNGVINAERHYLEEKEKHPLTTDLKYFLLAIFNIVTFRVRSS